MRKHSAIESTPASVFSVWCLDMLNGETIESAHKLEFRSSYGCLL